MSNDPKKMQKTQMTDEEFEAFYGELFREFGPPEEDLLEGSPVNKNNTKTVRTAGQPQKSAPRKYQGTSVPAYGGNLDEKRTAPAPKKEKSLKGLVICACAESLAIVAVVLWWVLRIL